MRSLRIASSFTSAPLILRSCRLNASTTCWPMRFTGFSEVAGSCGTKPTCGPRTRANCLSFQRVTSERPSKIRPPVRDADDGSSPSAARMTVVLPDPDSPTSATNSPGYTFRLNWSTAGAERPYLTPRASTSNNGNAGSSACTVTGCWVVAVTDSSP